MPVYDNVSYNSLTKWNIALELVLGRLIDEACLLVTLEKRL